MIHAIQMTASDGTIVESEHAAGRVRPLALAMSPLGAVRLKRGSPEDAAPIEAAVAERIERAFAAGAGQGLLHLGLAEVETALPPSLGYFRDLARRFVTRVCRVPDLEKQRERVAVPHDGEDLDGFARAAPPMTGAEYVSTELLERVWGEIEAAFRSEVAAHDGTVQSYLEARNPLWNLIGRVCFHLAENKRDAAKPFAFLATYTTRLASAAKVQHLPLGRALTEYAGAKNKTALLSLLLPVQCAAGRSALVKELVGSGEVFHPLAWTPREAYAFLRDIPLLESSGVVVRVPDWWKGRRGPRPEVRVTIGGKAPADLGANAMLDFKASLSLGGEPISAEEWAALLASSDGLALVKGRWVEIDRTKLDEVLVHWKKVERAAKTGGITFAEGMRLLAGAALEGGERAVLAETTAEWSKVTAGAWLAKALEDLRSPAGSGDADPGPELRATLRPYQKTGVAWLRVIASLGLGGCLADDMGLGKTIQVLALFLLLKRQKGRGPHLLVVPASLIANWEAEAARFAPGLRLYVAHPSTISSAELAKADPARLTGVDVVVTSYGSLHGFPWLGETAWDLVVLDEAQAIKNPGARQTRAAKDLRARARLALTGTPVENRLGDLWSLFDFLCPGLLGPAKVFSGFAKRLEAAGSYAPLRALVRPYILRRLKSDRSIIADLPDKAEVRAFCTLTKKQVALYQQSVGSLAKELEEKDVMERRGVILAYLLRLKQICNHPAQWLGQGAFAPDESGKLARLRELCEGIAARQEKAIIFTQFREMCDPIARFLETVFGRAGLVLHGEIPVKKRIGLVEAFQEDAGPPFFVLSLKAGGTGLNLTAAAHVIHFDRWWNPAVENQATDRAYRIGQRKNVLVHKFVCRGTVEEKIDALIESKRTLATEVVEGGGDVLLTEMGNAELLKLVALDIHSALEET
jgi:superfamily II DNA or RNA helicase